MNGEKATAKIRQNIRDTVKVIEKLRSCQCRGYAIHRPDCNFQEIWNSHLNISVSRHIIMSVNTREVQSMKLMAAQGDWTRMEEAEHADPTTQLSQIRNLDGTEMTTEEMIWKDSWLGTTSQMETKQDSRIQIPIQSLWKATTLWNASTKQITWEGSGLTSLSSLPEG